MPILAFARVAAGRKDHVDVGILAVVGVIVVPQLRASTLPKFKETDLLIAMAESMLPDLSSTTATMSEASGAMPTYLGLLPFPAASDATCVPCP